MWIEDVCLYHLFWDPTPSFWARGLQNFGENDRRAFFCYISLIYELDFTKFKTIVRTIAAHKPGEFQQYPLRKSPLWDKKSQK